MSWTAMHPSTIRRSSGKYFRLCVIRHRSEQSQGDTNASLQEILSEAGKLSRSLYRICIRSVRHIRFGNENDEKEFQERERKSLEEPRDKNSRLSMFSLLPPVDREDELRSRSEYYLQYLRENFVAEANCLDYDPLFPRHIDRFVYQLRKGEDHRKWLLKDMKFDDPYNGSFDLSRVQLFEKWALKCLGADEDSIGETRQHEDDIEGEDDLEWTDDDDDDDETPGQPEWHRNPRDS